MRKKQYCCFTKQLQQNCTSQYQCQRKETLPAWESKGWVYEQCNLDQTEIRCRIKHSKAQLCKESLLHTGCTQVNRPGSVYTDFVRVTWCLFIVKKPHCGFSACYKIYGRDSATNHNYYYLKWGATIYLEQWKQFLKGSLKTEVRPSSRKPTNFWSWSIHLPEGILKDIENWSSKYFFLLLVYTQNEWYYKMIVQYKYQNEWYYIE